LSQPQADQPQRPVSDRCTVGCDVMREPFVHQLRTVVFACTSTEPKMLRRVVVSETS
jgi:hypothetical protein